MEIPKVYNPKDSEEKWYNFWLEKGYFSSRPRRQAGHPEPGGRKPFTIVIPPPNITGSLHMGHALNNTLQDVIIRFKRMQGYNACWVPGTDHGGIATQNVVEKILLKEGLTRQELGRENFLARMWQWRKETGETILHQLKKLGCSCDWERLKFTLDETCSRTVLNAFIELYKRGLIYRGSRLVNWCIRCGTALADIEVEYREHKGHLWYIKYSLKPGHQVTGLPGYIMVATTRPETMLGDTAVAVHPEDKRYRNLIGKTVILPLMNREIPIIADEVVDSSFGTGAVKVTPAHDFLDFGIALQHQLKKVTVIDKEGKMTGETKEYANLDRYQCREKVVKDLQALNLLEKVEEYIHRVGHCYRCGTVIEPLISEQWFLSTEEMARRAMEVVKEGEIKFFPERWFGPYLQWLENLRDWCISRQIWWGHRIPIWYCMHCLEKYIVATFSYPSFNKQVKSEGGIIEIFVDVYKLSYQQIKDELDTYWILDIPQGTKGVYASEKELTKCEHCGHSDFIQDPDVLDTWFSSALWPFSVFGWPATAVKSKEQRAKSENTSLLHHFIASSLEDLDYYYPTSVLVTGYEILYLWVARMVMMGLELVGDIPFENVYIHGIVRDVSGRKMSKSLGNVIDPLDIMKTCGTDALRFALLYGGVTGQDLCLSEESFLMARNFVNKIWNASRFVLMNLEGFTSHQLPPPAKTWRAGVTSYRLSLTERWVISEYQRVVNSVTKNLNNYLLSDAAGELYEFFWHKFCDWYLELSKIHLTEKEEFSTSKVQLTREILVYILEGTLKLFHPFMPFITEEIWQKLRIITQSPESIMVSPWPEYDEEMIDEKASEKMRLLMEIISAIRNLRSEAKIPPKEKISLIFKVGSPEKEKLIRGNQVAILSLTNGEKLEFGIPESKDCLFTLIDEIEIYIPLTIIDREKEIKRLEKEIEIFSLQIGKMKQKLSDQNFFKNAPEEEIKKIKHRLKETEERKNKLEQLLIYWKGD